MDNACRSWLKEKESSVISIVKQIYVLNAKQTVEANKPKQGCFIATMAYGDYNHPQVIFLRKYRDNNLRKYIFGKVLIELYYHISPKIVYFSGDNKYIKKFARCVLDCLIRRLKNNIKL